MKANLNRKPSFLIIVLMILQATWTVLISPFLFFDLYPTPAEMAESARTSLEIAFGCIWLLAGLVASISILMRRTWGWWSEFVFLLPFAAAGISGLVAGPDLASAIPIAMFGLAAPAYVLWLAVNGFKKEAS